MSNTHQAAAMIATLVLGKALGAVCFNPGMRPRYVAASAAHDVTFQHVHRRQSSNDKVGESVAEYDGDSIESASRYALSLVLA
jgi:hypothetical protein